MYVYVHIKYVCALCYIFDVIEISFIDLPGRNCFTKTRTLRLLLNIIIDTLSCALTISQFFSTPFCIKYIRNGFKYGDSGGNGPNHIFETLSIIFCDKLM